MTFWDDPFDEIYPFVRGSELAPMGLTEAQIQVVWLQTVLRGPRVNGYVTLAESLSTGAPSYAAYLQGATADVLRTLRIVYRNLKMVFMSNGNYMGYQAPGLDQQPPPFDYEIGFAVKGVIEAQIEQMRTGIVNPVTGNLDYNSGIAPLVVWCDDIWVNDAIPRSDGFQWFREDSREDGAHPAVPGIAKVATRMLDIFLTSPYSQPWFAA